MKKLGFILLILLNFTSMAQQGNNWCFGWHGGLKFSENGVDTFSSAIWYGTNLGSPKTSSYNSTTISDCIGNILFYSNGYMAWNKNHQLMPHSSLPFFPNPMPCASIFQVPGNTSRFFMISDLTLNGVRGYYFSIVDMNLDGGLGDIDTNFTSILISTLPNYTFGTIGSNRLSIITHANGIDKWIYIYNGTTNMMMAFLATSSGISTTPVLTNLTSLGITNPFTSPFLNGPPVYYFRASHDEKTLLLGTQSSSVIIEFKVNNSTGALFAKRNIVPRTSINLPNSIVTNLELSSNDSLLYFGCRYETNNSISVANTYESRIYQINRYSSTAPIVIHANSLSGVNVFPDNSFSTWGMQIGPDQKIYCTHGDSLMSIINYPNISGSGCSLSYRTLSLGSNYSGYTTPNIYFPIRRIQFSSNASLSNSCVADSVFFQLQKDTDLSQIRWYFYTINNLLVDSTDLINPVRWFDNGKYIVRVRAKNPLCDSYTWWNDTIYVKHAPLSNLSIDSVNISCATHFVRIKYHAQYADSVNIDWKDGTISNWVKADTVGFLSHSYYDSSHVYPILVSLKNSTCNTASSINDTVKIQARPLPKFFAANASKSFPIAGCTPLQLHLTDSSKNADSVWYVAISSNGIRISSSSPKVTLTDTGYYKITQFVSNHDGCLDSSVVINAAYVSPKPILSVAIDSSFPRCIQKNLLLKINHAFNDSLLVQWGDGFTNSFASLGNFRTDTISHAYANAGVYAVRIKIRNAFCDTQTTFSHLVRPALQHTTSNDTTLCKGALLSLWALASGGDSLFTYILKDSSTTLINASGSFLVSPPVTTVYRIGSINACALDTLWKNITVTVRKPIKITLNTTDTVVCNGAPFVIKASAVGGTGVFTYLLKKNGITLQSNTSGSFVVNVIADETYTVLVTDFCTPVNDSSTVHLKPFPILQFTQPLPDLYFCASDTKVLHALTSAGAPARTYQWMDASGTLLSAVDSLVLTPSTSFVLVLKITDACTTIIDTASVFVMPEPNDTLLSSEVLSGCAPLTVNFESANMVYSNNLEYEALWDFGDGNTLVQNFNSSSISLKAKHTYINPGVYPVRVQVKFKNASSYCFSFVTSIEALSVPQIALQITPAKITLPKTECTATITSAQADSIVIEWDDGFSDNFNTNLTSFTQTHQYFDTGHYVVKAIAYHKNSCYTETRAKVFHADTFLCYIPNIFTPNRDNLNEVFKPVVSYCKKYELTIYNRWGELVFENTYISGQSTITGWDGGDYPSETYLYQIIARDGDNNRHTFSGTVMLVR